MTSGPRPRPSDIPKGLSLQTKFSLGMTVILLIVTGALSYWLYRELEKSLINSVYEKSEIILAELEATRKYVSDTLRPRIYSLLPSDEFILEAMSTTYVSTKIMERFRSSFPDFLYKRAAINSRNPKNEADVFEKDIMDLFLKDREMKDWKGVVTRNQQRFFVRMVPIYVESSCLHCHADQQSAPRKLLDLYGGDRGFGRIVGDIAGMDVLFFPVESAMGQIGRQAITVLGSGVIAAVAALFLVSLLFKRLVVNRMARLKGFFNEFGAQGGDLSQRLDVTQWDEIGEVGAAVNTMAEKLNTLMEERNKLLVDSVAQRERMRSIFDGITDRLMLIAPDHTVLMANSASTMRNRPSTGQSKCYELIHGLDAPCSGCLLRTTLNEKAPTFGELSHPDGETYLAHFYPILDKATGQVESVVHYCKSITEKKKMEQNMMQAEKLASLGQLVAGFAHELNNPLAVVLFYAEILTRELPESPYVEDAKVIEKHAETCKTIVQDLLTFSRNVETLPVPGDLNETIRNVLAVLEKQFNKAGIRLEAHFDPELPQIPLDESKIQQVWMNLLLNARQAIENGEGLIRVTTTRCAESGGVRVAVEDNGHGIPPEIIHKIFDPFFSTKKIGEGTGLGLSVSYGIIRQHSGDIRVASAPGTGSVFEVYLPGKEPEPDHVGP
jgi:two-component system, NtrC family, sensor kinase